MSRKVDIAKFSFIRSFKIKCWQCLLFSALDQGGGRGSLHRIHCPLYKGSVVEVQNFYDFLLDLVGKRT